MDDAARVARVRDQLAMQQAYSYTPKGVNGAGGVYAIAVSDLEVLLRLAAEALSARAATQEPPAP